MDYIKRIVDKEIDVRMEAFSAINIVGPKGCGKTRTASERAKTIIAFQDPEKGKGYKDIANSHPTLFLKREKPILFDEWKDAPGIWDMVRWESDNNGLKGQFFLTGSTSKEVATSHTGTGRISTLQMRTMSLLESGESSGSVSLSSIFDDPEYEIDGRSGNLTLEELFYLLCRGGWPSSLGLGSERASLAIAKDYYEQIYKSDISSVDGVKRDPSWTKNILASLARNVSTPVKLTTLYADTLPNSQMSIDSLADYLKALKKLYVYEEIGAYSPNIRSKTAIRTISKKIFMDPSLAAAALGIEPSYFYGDLRTFGLLFENMVLRDLLIYGEAIGCDIDFYRDDFGLEVDAIMRKRDGRSALIEIKTGSAYIEEGEKNLLKFRDLIRKHNEEGKSPSYREPDHLIVIVADAPMAYTRPSGVKVIPYGAIGI